MLSTSCSHTTFETLNAQDVKMAETLMSLEKEKKRLLTIENKTYPYLLTYTPARQKELINAIIAKYGRITFYNNQNRIVRITSADSTAFNQGRGGTDVLLTCAFVFNNRSFKKKPWLTTMLQDGRAFVPNIAKTVAERLEEIDKKIAVTKKSLTAESSGINACGSVRTLSSEKASMTKKIQLNNVEAVVIANKSCSRIKSMEESLTAAEKEILLRWICANIYSIKIYCLATGRSERALKRQYTDMRGIHCRSPKYDEEGRVVSHDSISGELYFTNTKNAPEEILRKVCSTKRDGTLFKGVLARRLCDKNLALYLLAQYSSYGFAAGVKHLNKQINIKALIEDKFNAN